MGMGGHMLGDRKLHRLQRLTGLPLVRAVHRNGACAGICFDPSGQCHHFEIDFKTGEHHEETVDYHWSSCGTWCIEHGHTVKDGERCVRCGWTVGSEIFQLLDGTKKAR